MKVGELNIFNKESLTNEILNTEISKEGFRSFFEKNKTILQLVLQDDFKTVHVFEKDGTYPFDHLNGERYWDPTGYFINKPQGRQRGVTFKIYAHCKNNFNCINFFENGMDFNKLKENEDE